MPRTRSNRLITPSMAAGLAASGICLNQVSQVGPPSLSALGQRVEALALFSGQPIGQPTMGFSTCMVTEVGAEPFKRGGRRDDNTAPAAILHHRFGQVGKPIVLDRLRQKCAGQFSREMFAERLMRKLGLCTFRPTRNTSKPSRASDPSLPAT